MSRSSGVGVLLALLTACTYGPEEPSARAHQVVRLGDSYRALVVARSDTRGGLARVSPASMIQLHEITKTHGRERGGSPVGTADGDPPWAAPGSA